MFEVTRARNKNYGFNLIDDLGQVLKVGSKICWWLKKRKAQEKANYLNNKLKNNQDFYFKSLIPCTGHRGGYGTTEDEENNLVKELYQLRREIRQLQNRYNLAKKNQQIKTAHVLLSLLNDKKQFLKDIIRINKNDYAIIMEEVKEF